MKRWMFGLVGAAVLAALGWGIFLRFSPERLVNLPPTAMGPWVAFGDSLTELMSDAVHPNERGYAQIAGRLEAELSPWMAQLR